MKLDQRDHINTISFFTLLGTFVVIRERFFESKITTEGKCNEYNLRTNKTPIVKILMVSFVEGVVKQAAHIPGYKF